MTPSVSPFLWVWWSSQKKQVISEPLCTRTQSIVCHFNVYVPRYLCVIWFRAFAMLRLKLCIWQHLHLIERYQSWNAALFGTSLLSVTQPSRRLYHSCLSMRFYLFIFAHFLSFVLWYCSQDDCWFTMKWRWKDWLAPSLSYIPSCVDPLSLNTEGHRTESMPPGL